MELTIPEGVEIDLGNNSEFCLPPYVTRLLPEQIASGASGQIVIAAGTDPKDGLITLVTLDGKIMIFDAPRFYIPHGPSMPSHGGLKVFLPNLGGRWPGPVEGFHVDAEWILKNSTSALVGAKLNVPIYKHEDKTK